MVSIFINLNKVIKNIVIIINDNNINNRDSINIWVCKVNIENLNFMLCLGFVSYLVVNFKLLKVR